MRNVLFATLALVLFITQAQAEERHHAARGTGHFTSEVGDFVSEGIATHLGPFYEVGNVQFGDMSDLTAIPISGWAVHTAANGDLLCETISGTLNWLTGAGTATMTCVGGTGGFEGTGRFEDASATAVFSIQLLGGGAFEYSGKGTIDY